MKKLRFLVLLSFCWIITNETGFSQQRVNADFLKGTSTWLCANYITDLDYAFLDNEEIQIRELDSEESGSLEFIVNHLANSQIIVSLVDRTNPINNYFIELSGTTFMIQGVAGSGGTFADGDQFKIERCDDNILFYGPGNMIYYEITGVNATEHLVAKMEVVSALQLGVDVPNIEMSFPHTYPFANCVRSHDNYAVLKKKLDGAHVAIINNRIRFRYDQDYVIVDNKNDRIRFNIYDWEKNAIHTGDLNNRYGTNFHEIIIPSSANLTPNDFYVLEVTGLNKKGLNKGERYYLKLKY